MQDCSNPWDPSVHTCSMLRLHQQLAVHAAAWLRRSAAIHTTSLASASELLQHPEHLQSSRMSNEELQSLAFILGMKEEVYMHFTDPASAASELADSRLATLDPLRKLALVQKLVAASGVQSTPMLLAWATDTIKQACIVQLTHGTDVAHGALAQPWFQDLLPLASVWAAKHQSQSSGMHALDLNENQLVLQLLKAPGAFRWEDLLALPHLPYLTTSLAEHDPMLRSVLGMLGLPPTPLSQLECTDPGAPFLTAHAAATLCLQTKQQMAAKLAGQSPQQSSQGPPSDLLTQAAASSPDLRQELAAGAVALRLTRYTLEALGAQPPHHAVLIQRLLRCESQQPAASLSPLASPQGSSNVDSSAQSSSSKAHTASMSGGFTSEVAGSFPQGNGSDSRSGGALIQAAALELAAGQSDARYMQQVMGASHSQVADALLKAAKTLPKGASAGLARAIQDRRVEQLLAGDILAMASATAADVDALDPQQFWQVRAHAQRQEAAGQALLRALTAGPGVLTNITKPGHALDLDQVWALPIEDRAALGWVMLRGTLTPTASKISQATTTLPAATSTPTSGTKFKADITGRAAARPQLSGPAAATALMAAAARRASGAAAAASASAQAVRDLAAAMKVERQLAELDLVDDRLPPLFELPTTGEAELPPADAMAAARAALPETQLLLFDLLRGGAEQPGFEASPKQLSTAFNMLLTLPGGSITASSMLDMSELSLPPTLAAWVADSKLRLVSLSAPTLALLSQFLELRVQGSQAFAVESQQRLRALLTGVQEALSRLQGPQKGSSHGSSGEISPYWTSPTVPPLLENSEAEGAIEAHGLPTAPAVAALLGEREAAEWEAWLTASAASRGREVTAGGSRSAQAYRMLDEQHLSMDMERYLVMEHDPQLHVVLAAPPRPWQEAPPAASPAQFLDTMRPLLDRYLTARSMRPLLEAEWAVYAQGALAEAEDDRVSHEAALRSQGRSTFFNSRAEAVYLRQILAAGIPSDAPLAVQAIRYLTVLEANSSWTFSQKKRVVKRVVELSQYFAKQPPPTEYGSPFAPLFAGKVPLAPPPMADRRAARAAARTTAASSS